MDRDTQSSVDIRAANEGQYVLKLQSGPNDFFDARPVFRGGRWQTELNTINNRDLVILNGTGNTGIGTTAPQSTLQVAGNGTSYGNYLQIPMVSSPWGPPASDCNSTTLAGRMVLQDNAGIQVTLWICSAATGTWVAK